MKEEMGLKGTFEIKNLSTGESRIVPNTIVTIGKAAVAGRIYGTTPAAFGSIAIGLGSSTIVAGDSALGSEAYRKSMGISQITETVTNDTVQFTGSIIVDATKAINEAGLFNAASAGSMLSRTTFVTLNVGSEDVINTTWKITVG